MDGVERRHGGIFAGKATLCTAGARISRGLLGSYALQDEFTRTENVMTRYLDLSPAAIRTGYVVAAAHAVLVGGLGE